MFARSLPGLCALVLATACGGGASDDREPPAADAPADEPAATAPAPADPTDDADEADAGAPEDPGPPVPAGPPADWGHIKPPVPPPAAEELTIHAVAGFPVVAVYSQPDLESPRLGYLRFGQRMMVSAKVDDTGEGCAKGFHALPAGGFACASKGLLIGSDKPPYMYLPPPPPRLDDPLPYDYGAIGKDGTAMWWRTADRDEIALAQEKYDAQMAALEPAEGDGTSSADGKAAKPTPADSGGDSAGDSAGSELPSVTAEPPAGLTEEQREALRLEAEAKRRRDEERAAELAEKAAKLPLHAEKPFMEKGFIITLGEKVKDKGRTWWRTTRGGFVEAGRTWKKKTYDFHGAELPEGTELPFGFVMEEDAVAFGRNEAGELKRARKLEYREFLDFTEEVEVGGKKYLVTADGLHVRSDQVRLAEPQPRPEQVAAWEKWIDVDLGRQLLVAYDGDTPVYATLVSTGKKGTEEESFETPTGTYRIETKHISSSMDGTTASDGNYSIQDVPWAMFFKDSYALHGAFWHQRFGRKRSHGCVNLGPTDARWLFFWTTPILPEGWHGVKSHEGAPGTLVQIHD